MVGPVTTATPTGILSELQWRGLVNQASDLDAIAELTASPISLYCGFDPSAESLHIGNLVPLLSLRRFQLAGHTPVALVGGATGLIGDPSGRTSERDLVAAEVVSARAEKIEAEIRRLLPPQEGLPDPIVANNLDWFGSLSAVEFLRDYGKHFPVRTMLSKTSVKERIAAEGPGLSFTEFSYMLIQALDFVELNRRHGCRMQVGGADQWGNMTAGLDLAERMRVPGLQILTFPLVTMSDGRKFGKSEAGAIYLSAKVTSEWDFFQFWINVPDADAPGFLRLFTFLGPDELERLEAEHAQRPADRVMQERLAVEATSLVHGPDVAAQIAQAATALFGSAGELGRLGEPVLDMLTRSVPTLELAEGDRVVEALVRSGLAPSAKEARRMGAAGAVYLNGERIADPEMAVASVPLLHGRYAVLRRGKKRYVILRTA